MTRGKEPSADLCWAVIRMDWEHVPIDTVKQYTNLSLRTIGKIHQRYRDTGDPTPSKKSKNYGNRRQILGITELKVNSGLPTSSKKAHISLDSSSVPA